MAISVFQDFLRFLYENSVHLCWSSPKNISEVTIVSIRSYYFVCSAAKEIAKGSTPLVIFWMLKLRKHKSHQTKATTYGQLKKGVKIETLKSTNLVNVHPPTKNEQVASI
eukprot:6473314-Amphidinium_carterae.1